MKQLGSSHSSNSFRLVDVYRLISFFFFFFFQHEKSTKRTWTQTSIANVKRLLLLDGSISKFTNSFRTGNRVRSFKHDELTSRRNTIERVDIEKCRVYRASRNAFSNHIFEVRNSTGARPRKLFNPFGGRRGRGEEIFAQNFRVN